MVEQKACTRRNCEWNPRSDTMNLKFNLSFSTLYVSKQYQTKLFGNTSLIVVMPFYNTIANILFAPRQTIDFQRTANTEKHNTGKRYETSTKHYNGNCAWLLRGTIHLPNAFCQNTQLHVHCTHLHNRGWAASHSATHWIISTLLLRVFEHSLELWLYRLGMLWNIQDRLCLWIRCRLVVSSTYRDKTFLFYINEFQANNNYFSEKFYFVFENVLIGFALVVFGDFLYGSLCCVILVSLLLFSTI